MTCQQLIDEICGDPKHFPWSTDTDTGASIAAIIKMCGYKRVAEIGTFMGLTTIQMAEAVGGGGLVITLDREIFCSETFSRYNHSDRIRFINADSLQPIGEMVQCLFLDGDHSFDRVMAELDSQLPFVERGGLVLFHDAIRDDVKKAMLFHRELIGQIVLPTKNRPECGLGMAIRV
jgi:predicted O-methyltransferase YrrM